VARLKPWWTPAATCAARWACRPRSACRCWRGRHGEDSAFLRANAAVLQNLAKLSEVKVFDDEAAWASGRRTPRSTWWRRTPGAVVEIDVAAEKARLSKEAAPRRRDRQGQRQAGNEAFCAKAPAAVLEQEKKRLADFGARWHASGATRRLGWPGSAGVPPALSAKEPP
jgi:valyl-tRNA synthetase